MKIKDIAEMANTSVSTVSRVINGDQNVKQPTREKVLAVIKKTGYKPNVMGRNLRRQSSNNILAILPTMANPIYSAIIRGVEQRANAHHFDVVIVISHRNSALEKKYLEMLYTKEVDGVITFVSFLDDDVLEKTASQYPLVLCSGTAKCEHLSYTCIDNERAAYDATSYLIELGHQKIARISGSFSKRYETERDRGYERAMKKHGMNVCDEYIINDGQNYRDGYVFAKELMALDNPPTAIFASSDTIASGCIKYLGDAGIKAGVDVDVMGFDNLPLGEILTPTLSTVAQPLETLGSTAFDLLYEKMQNINSARKRVILDHKLVVRDSTRNHK